MRVFYKQICLKGCERGSDISLKVSQLGLSKPDLIYFSKTNYKIYRGHEGKVIHELFPVKSPPWLIEDLKEQATLMEERFVFYMALYQH